jgi:UDP-N-acetyl-2-amino-2-deoxyglucuronate dehydrogenase
MLIKTGKIKLAIVGCGHIAKKHIEAIQLFPEDLEVVAACDSHTGSLASVVKGTSMVPFTDYQQLLDSKLADVIVLCSPSGLHAQQTILAAQQGYHIICEKPMATRWEDALEMVRVCEKQQVRLFVVKQNRFNSTIQRLKQALDAGRFGQLYHVNCNVYWTRPQDYYDQSPWRGTWAFDGGALMNQASHYVDLLLYLFGPVAKVQAMAATLARKIEVEDTISLNIQWRSGMIGSMNVTMLTYPKNFEGSMTVLGEKGTVKLGGLAVNEIAHWQFSETFPEDNNINLASEETTMAYGFGHPKLYQNIIQVFRGAECPLIDGREGLKSLELLIAAYRAAEHDVTISLPLEV